MSPVQHKGVCMRRSNIRLCPTYSQHLASQHSRFSCRISYFSRKYMAERSQKTADLRRSPRPPLVVTKPEIRQRQVSPLFAEPVGHCKSFIQSVLPSYPSVGQRLSSWPASLLIIHVTGAMRMDDPQRAQPDLGVQETYNVATSRLRRRHLRVLIFNRSTPGHPP